MDSLAKEKSKDKGTPSSFNVHSDILPLHEGFSPPVSSCFVATLTSRSPASEPEGQSVVSAPPRAGEQRGYKNTVSVYWALTVYI